MREKRPQAVRVRPSGDPARPVELALNDEPTPAAESPWDRVHFTRAQARTVALAFTAELARPPAQHDGHRDDPAT